VEGKLSTVERKSTLYTLIFAAVVAMLPNSILFPATVDIAKHLHVPVSFIGLMVSTYSVAYVISTPFLGILSDHAGRRVVLVGGLTLFALGGIVPLVTQSTTLILIGRAVMGVGSAGIMPMVESIIGDTYSAGPKRRAALARFTATIAVADALVPFTGGVVDSFDWRLVFVLYLSGLIAAICSFVVLPPGKSHVEARTWGTYLRSLQIAMRTPSLMGTLVGAITFGTVYFGVCALLPLALEGRQTGTMNGMLFLPIGVSWVLTSHWLSRRPHLRHVHRWIAFAAFALFLVTVWLSFAHQLYVLLFIALVWGFGSGTVCTMYTWIVGDDSPDTVRGAMNALFNASFVLGFSIGAPLFMFIQESVSFQASAAIAAVTMLISCVLALTLLKPHHQSQRVDKSKESAKAEASGL
jgi:MFS transporter, ACDE family, multidrug resistance protein